MVKGLPDGASGPERLGNPGPGWREPDAAALDTTRPRYEPVFHRHTVSHADGVPESGRFLEDAHSPLSERQALALMRGDHLVSLGRRCPCFITERSCSGLEPHPLRMSGS
jgi:hypothetical protein